MEIWSIFYVHPHAQESRKRLPWKPCIFFIVQLSLSLRTKILCISGVPMNDLAPMKNCPGGGGGQFDKVGQISSRGVCLGFIGASLALIFQRPLRKLAMQYTEIFLA